MTRSDVARWSALTCALALAAAAGAWWAGRQPPEAPQAANDAGNPVSVVNGQTVVQVDPAVQQHSRIETRQAAQANRGAAPRGTPLPGVVIDLQPLIEWRSQLAAARGRVDAAVAQARTSEAELARTQALYVDRENASRKALEAAQGTQVRDRSQQASARAALRAIEQKGREQFGPVLARTDLLDDLLAAHEALVAVAVGDSGGVPRVLDIEMIGVPATRAAWLSAAARADANLGAGLQLYRVRRSLPANAPVVARAPAAGPAGTLVPVPAVVWHAGQPWAYVRRDPSHFTRMTLGGAIETREGFVVPDGIRPGDAIVTQGAQLLLSRELLPPPGGAACRAKDPDEC